MNALNEEQDALRCLFRRYRVAVLADLLLKLIDLFLQQRNPLELAESVYYDPADGAHANVTLTGLSSCPHRRHRVFICDSARLSQVAIRVRET